MVTAEEHAAALACAERAEAELAAVRADNVEIKALLHTANDRVAELVGQLAKLTDRVTELAAAAARGKRGASP